MPSGLILLIRLLDDPRVRALLFGLWCAGWVAICLLSLIQIGIPGPSGSDKVVHFATYAFMSAAAVAFCRHPGHLLLIAVAAAAIGGMIEVAQGFVSYRYMSLGDAIANTLGAALGYGLALMLASRLRAATQPG